MIVVSVFCQPHLRACFESQLDAIGWAVSKMKSTEAIYAIVEDESVNNGFSIESTDDFYIINESISKTEILHGVRFPALDKQVLVRLIGSSEKDDFSVSLQTPCVIDLSKV